MKVPWLGMLLLAALLAGCTALPRDEGQPPARAPDRPEATIDLTQRFVHEHAAFAVFVLGEHVAFNHTDYDLSRRGNASAHLHVNEEHGGGVVHIEGHFPGGVPRVTLQEFFAIHGVGYANGSLTLDTHGTHNGSAWRDTPQHRWELWVQEHLGAWEPRPEGPRWVLRDHQRLLLTYGAGEGLAAQQDQVPPAPGAPRAQPA